jgi:hypothetical protein
MRILLVEDNLSLAEGLVTLLRQSGYAVDVVHDGASAEALAAAESFDLVILDLNLPQMDGIEVLRKMRARKNPAAVMILTAGWIWAPTITSSSPLTSANSRPASVRFCAVRRACAIPPSALAIWCWTRRRAAFCLPGSRWTCRRANAACLNC